MTCNFSDHHLADASPLLLLGEWKRLTSVGLEASRTHCAAHALAWHVQALRISHRLLQCPEADIAADDRLAAFVVGHLNIADCYASLNQPGAAAECVNCAHRKLISLLQDQATPEPLRQAAYRQLHQTFAAQSQYDGPHAALPTHHQAAPGALLH